MVFLGSGDLLSASEFFVDRWRDCRKFVVRLFFLHWANSLQKSFAIQ